MFWETFVITLLKAIAELQGATHAMFGIDVDSNVPIEGNSRNSKHRYFHKSINHNYNFLIKI